MPKPLHFEQEIISIHKHAHTILKKTTYSIKNNNKYYHNNYFSQHLKKLKLIVTDKTLHKTKNYKIKYPCAEL